MSKLSISLLVITAIFAAIFLTYPNLDLTVSSWFYDNGFIYRKHPLNLAMYWAIRVITGSIALWVTACLVMPKIKPDYKAKWLIDRQYPIYIFIAMILGPGVIVHQGFKPYYERARPVNVEEFGGVKTYTAPFVKSNQGGKSFISGHSAMGFFLTAFAFLTIGKKRCYLYILGVGFGILSAVSRITQGGHFLSDTLFGGLVTLLTIQLIHWLIIKRKRQKIKA